MTALEAQTEFCRIVAEELPNVKVTQKKTAKGMEWVKASKKDAALSHRLSTRLAELHELIIPGEAKPPRKRGRPRKKQASTEEDRDNG